MTGTTLALSFPPSVNALWRAVGGRSIMSAAYRDWRAVAGTELMAQRPKKLTGPVSISVWLNPPDKRRRDLDNAGFKAIIDLLVEHRVIEADDSRIVRRIEAEWVDSGDPCTVAVAPVRSEDSFQRIVEAGAFNGLMAPKTEGAR